MKIPCAKQVPFVVTGLAFLQPALTNIQFDNLTLIASTLVLRAGIGVGGYGGYRGRTSATL